MLFCNKRKEYIRGYGSVSELWATKNQLGDWSKESKEFKRGAATAEISIGARESNFAMLQADVRTLGAKLVAAQEQSNIVKREAAKL